MAMIFTKNSIQREAISERISDEDILKKLDEAANERYNKLYNGETKYVFDKLMEESKEAIVVKYFTKMQNTPSVHGRRVLNRLLKYISTNYEAYTLTNTDWTELFWYDYDLCYQNRYGESFLRSIENWWTLRYDESCNRSTK